MPSYTLLLVQLLVNKGLCSTSLLLSELEAEELSVIATFSGTSLLNRKSDLNKYNIKLTPMLMYITRCLSP